MKRCRPSPKCIACPKYNRQIHKNFDTQKCPGKKGEGKESGQKNNVEEEGDVVEVKYEAVEE